MRPRVLALAVCVCAAAAGGPPGLAGEPGPKAPAVRSARFLSKTYHVDRKYKSMLGPMSSEVVYLHEADPPELLWVTGYQSVVVGPDGATPASQEFMCHSNVDLNMAIHKRLFGLFRETPNRLFTLSQGQQEIRLPEGFGVPVLSSEPFKITSQVLNLNVEGRAFEVRHRITVDFVRDRDLDRPMKPVFQVSANALVLVEGKDGYFNIPEPDPNVHGSSCAVGESANEGGRIITDDYGRKFSPHWRVKPGRHEYRSNVTKFMRLPYDSTMHYAAVHLHPLAESLELRDVTAGRTVYLSRARNLEGKLGLDVVGSYSSAEGVPLYKDHQYELVSVYNNTTPEDQDAMAVMFLYVLDKEFRRPRI
jgi:hypothetical protein